MNQPAILDIIELRSVPPLTYRATRTALPRHSRIPPQLVVVSLILILASACSPKDVAPSLPKTMVEREALAQVNNICLIGFDAPIRRTTHRGEFPLLVHTLLKDYLTQVLTAMGPQINPVRLFPIACVERSEFYNSLRETQGLGIYPTKDGDERLLDEMAKLWSYSAANPEGRVSFRIVLGRHKEWTSGDSRLVVIDSSAADTRRRIANETGARGLLAIRSSYDIDINWVAPAVSVQTSAELYNNEGTPAWQTSQPLAYQQGLPLNRFRNLWIGFHKSVAFVNLTQSERRYVLDAVRSASVRLHSQMAKTLSEALGHDIHAARRR